MLQLRVHCRVNAVTYVCFPPRRYGLGTCYLRLNKLRQAEYHFRRATELHPSNAVLLGCLGLVRDDDLGCLIAKLVLIMEPGG
jgi:hypothetical protein